MSDYVSLHNHTTFSLMHSLIKPSELFKRAKELGQSAIAVTDSSSLAGAHDCLKYSREAGVKLIMGVEISFTDNLEDTNSRLRHVILLAKNHTGWKNLLALSKEGFDNGVVVFKKMTPRIDWRILEKYSEGLICTTACGGGILGQLLNTRRKDEAEDQAKRLKDIFGQNLALEIQPNQMKRIANNYTDYHDQTFVNHQLIKLGQKLDIKVIATTNAHFLHREDFEAHDVMVCGASGQPIHSGNRLKYTEDFYVKSRDEVLAAFAMYGSKAEEFCDNTLFFADMCENPDWIDPKFTNPSGKELPDFPVKDQPDYEKFLFWKQGRPELANKPEDVSYLRYWVENNFSKKVPSEKEKEYRDRVEEEFDVLEYRGFCSYLLIVADFLDWCRKKNISVGPGRGSVGGCLVAYLIDIHKADPIKYDLIFARFQNKEKVALPDIDLDIAPSGREHLHTYLKEKYGYNNVAHVSNVNTLTPKVYARTISRVMQYGGNPKTAVAIGNNLADAIPEEIKTMEGALTQAPLFAEYANSEKYHHLKKFASHLGGKPSAYSTHAGGIVIGKRPLVEIVPLRCDKNGEVAIEYEKERAEENGLVKIDTLGLETLDIIKTTYNLIEAQGKSFPSSNFDYEAYDEKTYDLISRGDTSCVFQLGGSAGTIELCRKVKPRSIEDISLINGLARPSAEDIREPLIEAREGVRKVELLHPSLQRAFGKTYSFGLFEESLLFLAQDVAGWDLHKADGLRKLTKEKGKNPKKAEALRKGFIEGAVKNKNIPEEIATKVWDEVVEKFQGYGFNLSHSVLYSMISYHTAYLKAHFPLEFLTANLMALVNSVNPKAKDRVLNIKNEIRGMNVRIIPPDINKSELTYKIIDDQTLLTGLDALKYIGKDAIPEIISKRPFNSFEEFLAKVNGSKVKAPTIQALAASGCLDSFGMSRRTMFLYAADFKKKLQVYLKKNKDYKGFNYPWPEADKDWSQPEKYAMEMFYIGEGLSCGVKEAYPKLFTKNSIDLSKMRSVFPAPKGGTSSFGEDYPLSDERDGALNVVIKNFFEFKVKKETSKIFGKTMAKMLVQDCYGNNMFMTCFPDGLKKLYVRIKELKGNTIKLEPGVGLSCAASLSWYEGDLSLTFIDLKEIHPIPPKPEDLEAKKVSMRISSASKKKKEDLDAVEIMDEIEDELIEDGMSDLDSFSDIDQDEDKIDVFN